MIHKSVFSTSSNKTQFDCRPLLSALIVLFFSLPAISRSMNSQDLKAIYETGLIPLTDDQEGVYKSGRDYLIFETMRVKRGDTVEFAPGARLFFHATSKITVHGVLKFNGTPEEPVTIGKLNVTIPKLSKKVNMQFDSTSFYIYRTAALIMKNVKIADSTISFRGTDSTSEFSFDSVICAGNRFTLPDTVLQFWPGSCITCTRDSGLLSDNCVPPPPPPDTQKVVVKNALTWSSFKIPIRISLGVGIITAAGIWYYYNDRAQDSYDLYHSKKSDFGSEKVDSRIAIRNRDIAAFAMSCGAASLTVTYLFGGGKK